MRRRPATRLFAALLAFAAAGALAQTADERPSDKPGALPSVPMPPAAECLQVAQAGTDASGAKDSAAAFQKAIDEAAGRKKVCVQKGSYRIGQRLLMKPGTHLVMHREALIVNAAQVGAGNLALIQSQSFTEKTNNVTIEGGTFTSIAGSEKYGGRVIGWYGDNWTVRNVLIKDWAQDGKPGRAINAVGDGAKILHNTIRNPGCGVGCAAIVISGGRDILIANNDVSAGDDGIAIFPVANKKNPHFNLAIKDVRVINNRSESAHARALAMGMHYLKHISDVPTDTSVEGIRVKGLVGRVTQGKPTAMAVLIENMTPRGVVKDIVLEDVHIEQTNLLGDGFKFARVGTGELSGITMVRSSFAGDCKSAALKIIGANGVTVRQSRLIASAGCSNAVFVDKASAGVVLAGNDIRGKTAGAAAK